MKDLLIKFATGGTTPVDQPDASQHISTTGSTDLMNTINTIIGSVIGILGIVCVVVMIIGGFNYMTSTGDAGKVKKAKDTILYGAIGLIVCVLSYAIVNFVINTFLSK